MIFKSLVFAQASGSTGGLVYSRNGGGMYVRSRANPTNPNTLQQQAVRDAMRVVVDAWRTAMNQSDRDTWNGYAFNTPTLNRLGEMTTKTGQQMFIRCNIARLQAGLPIVTTAPTHFDLGSFTPVGTFTADASTTSISIPFTASDAWANEDDSAMLVYQSREQNPTRTFGKGPFQLAGLILGDSTTPPTSPAVINSLFPLTAGNRLFLKLNVSRADGRYSDPENPTEIIVP